MTKPTVLFVCVHNAGRSQMAAGYMTRPLRRTASRSLSAGSEPEDQINPIAIEAMAEEGIDIARQRAEDPDDRAVQRLRRRDHDGLRRRLPDLPGKRYEDWELDDPAGQGIDAVRPIRDDIKRRIEALLAELLPATENQTSTR